MRSASRVLVPRVLTLAVITLWLALPGIASAQGRTTVGSEPAPEQVVLSGTASVPRGTTVGEVVVFHGRAIVSGSVHGDVVVLDGPITIDGGYITGSVVALRGVVHVTGTSLIGGDVLGGVHVTVDAGAKIGGEVRQHVGFTLQGPLGVLGVLLGSVALAVSTLLLGLLFLLIAPLGADRLASAATTAPLASLGWGIVVAIVLPVLCVVAAASIVGLPLGLALLLALALLFLAGLAWFAWAIGRAILPAPRARVLSFLAGWAIVAAAGLVPFVNIGVWGLGSAFGIGTLTVAVWRSRRAGRTGRHRVGGGFLPEEPVTVPPAEEEEVVSSAPSTSDD